MTSTTRKLSLALLLAAVAGALAAYIHEGPSWESLGMALLLINVFTPIKGVLYRRLGGMRPYASAFAANASSQLSGLPFHLALSFWPKIGASFAISGLIEIFTLVAMGTATSFKRSVLLAFYGSLVVHLITAGFFASQRSLLIGLPFIAAGIVLFHVPTFFPDEWVDATSGDPGESKWTEGSS
jgi:hypothetical protein